MQPTKLIHSTRFVFLVGLFLLLLASCAAQPEGDAAQAPVSLPGKTTGAGAEPADLVADRDGSNPLPSTGSGGSTGEAVDNEPPASSAAAPLDGPALLQAKCTRCHVISFFDEMKKTRSEWEWALKMMRVMGVKLEDSEKKILIDYLAQKPIE